MSDGLDRPELAATLRNLREQAGLSGIEAARRAGLSQSTVSRLETGRRAPTVKEVTVFGAVAALVFERVANDYRLLGQHRG